MKNKVLLLDIETAPIIAHTWGIWGRDIALNQIMQDWAIIAWSAKWLGDPESKMFYADQRGVKNVYDDAKLLKGIWKLIDEADVIITQNGVSFDMKKLNARFAINGYPPPSSYRQIDTKLIAKKKFGFTSNRLMHLAEVLKLPKQKLKSKKFPGHDLWVQCLAGNLEAWKEMELYNKSDVLALEALYNKLQPWDSNIDFNTLHDGDEHRCACGSTSFAKNGLKKTIRGVFQRYRCSDCGAEYRDKVNLIPAAKRQAMKVRV